MDVGTLYPIHEKITLGFVLKDLFDVVSWNSSTMGVYTQGSPVRMVAGAAIHLFPGYSIGLDLEKALHSDTQDRLRIGMERQLFDVLYLRGGAFQSLRPEAGMNYNFGLGLNYRRPKIELMLDAAYVIQDIENTVRLSFTIGF